MNYNDDTDNNIPNGRFGITITTNFSKKFLFLDFTCRGASVQ